MANALQNGANGTSLLLAAMPNVGPGQIVRHRWKQHDHRAQQQEQEPIGTLCPHGHPSSINASCANVLQRQHIRESSYRVFHTKSRKMENILTLFTDGYRTYTGAALYSNPCHLQLMPFACIIKKPYRAFMVGKDASCLLHRSGRHALLG